MKQQPNILKSAREALGWDIGRAAATGGIPNLDLEALEALPVLPDAYAAHLILESAIRRGVVKLDMDGVYSLIDYTDTAIIDEIIAGLREPHRLKLTTVPAWGSIGKIITGAERPSRPDWATVLQNARLVELGAEKLVVVFEGREVHAITPNQRVRRTRLGDKVVERLLTHVDPAPLPPPAAA